MAVNGRGPRRENAMQMVTSKDGSRIAFDRHGSGPSVILVGDALGYRKFTKMEELAQLLAERCTVISWRPPRTSFDRALRSKRPQARRTTRRSLSRNGLVERRGRDSNPRSA
jgi:hypothetical protein